MPTIVSAIRAACAAMATDEDSKLLEQGSRDENRRETDVDRGELW